MSITNSVEVPDSHVMTLRCGGLGWAAVTVVVRGTKSADFIHIFCILRSCSSFCFLQVKSVAYPGIFFGGFSTNSVEDRGQRERGSGGGSP
jgi:hypothetical protein